jgi:hypothetical protein
VSRRETGPEDLQRFKFLPDLLGRHEPCCCLQAPGTHAPNHNTLTPGTLNDVLDKP